MPTVITFSSWPIPWLSMMHLSVIMHWFTS
jgi:hypothetical protein